MEPSIYQIVSRAERAEESGDYETAEQLWNLVLAMQERKWGKESPKLIDTLFNFGQLCFALDDFVKAEKLLLRCLQIERLHLPVGDPSTAETVNALTQLHMEKYFARAQKKTLATA